MLSEIFLRAAFLTHLGAWMVLLGLLRGRRGGVLLGVSKSRLLEFITAFLHKRPFLGDALQSIFSGFLTPSCAGEGALSSFWGPGKHNFGLALLPQPLGRFSFRSNPQMNLLFFGLALCKHSSLTVSSAG